MRAAIMACTVWGIPGAPSAPDSSSMRTVSSRKSGLPSVVSSTAARRSALSGAGAPQLRASTRVSLSPRGSASSSIALARTLPPPHPGRPSSRSLRARQRIRIGTSRTLPARCSTRSSISSSAQWRSSNTSTSGCTEASSVAHVRAAQAISVGGAVTSHRVEHPGGEAEQVGDRLVAAAGPELLGRSLHRVVVGDPGRGLHHLGQRPVGDALAVREGSVRRGPWRARRPPRTRARAATSRPRARRRR